MDGNIIMIITIGRPIIVGVIKEANRFSFILILMVCLHLLIVRVGLKGLMGSFVLRFLVVLE